MILLLFLFLKTKHATFVFLENAMSPFNKLSIHESKSNKRSNKRIKSKTIFLGKFFKTQSTYSICFPSELFQKWFGFFQSVKN